MRNDARNPLLIADRLPVDGVGSRRQWLDAGASHAMFEDGRLAIVVRGVYALPSHVPQHHEVLESVRPLLASDTAIAGWAAGLLHRVRDAGPRMRTFLPEPIEICQPRVQHRAPPGCTTLRVDLKPDELAVIDGFVVPTIERTAYDMVRFCTSDEMATIVLDCFLYDLNPHPMDLEVLAALVEKYPRNRGNARVRRALVEANSRSRSPAETRFRLMMRELGVPRSAILVNPILDVPGEPDCEIDIVDTSSGVAGEYDGQTHANAKQRAWDARKDTIMTEAGLRRLRLGATDMQAPHQQCLNRLAQRRAAALRDGCDVRAMELVQCGQLREDPLHDYSQRTSAAGYSDL